MIPNTSFWMDSCLLVAFQMASRTDLSSVFCLATNSTRSLLCLSASECSNESTSWMMSFSSSQSYMVSAEISGVNAAVSAGASAPEDEEAAAEASPLLASPEVAGPAAAEEASEEEEEEALVEVTASSPAGGSWGALSEAGLGSSEAGEAGAGPMSLRE